MNINFNFFFRGKLTSLKNLTSFVFFLLLLHFTMLNVYFFILYCDKGFLIILRCSVFHSPSFSLKVNVLQIQEIENKCEMSFIPSTSFISVMFGVKKYLHLFPSHLLGAPLLTCVVCRVVHSIYKKFRMFSCCWSSRQRNSNEFDIACIFDDDSYIHRSL